MAPLAPESYSARAPSEIPKLLPGGPEQIALAPVTPKMNLPVAAEMPAPPPVPPMAPSVFLARPISVHTRASDAEELEFLIELARPGLAVSPETEGLVAAKPPEASAAENKTSAAEQKPIFEADFLPPWTLAEPPPADDLVVPAQIAQLSFRLMDAGQPQHHSLPVTTSGLRIETCFSEAPGSRISARVLPADHPADPPKNPGPPAVGDTATIQSSGASYSIFTAPQPVQAADPLVGFVILETMAFGLPLAVSRLAIPEISRPGELLPIEKAFANVGSTAAYRNELETKPVGPRSAVVLPRGAGACKTPGNYCQAVKEKSHAARAEPQPLDTLPPLPPAPRSPEIRYSRTSDGKRVVVPPSQALEIPGIHTLDVERPVAELRAGVIDVHVSILASRPVEPDPMSAITWRRPISTCQIGPEPTQVTIARMPHLPQAVPVPGEFRLKGPEPPEEPSVRISEAAHLRHRIAPLVTLRPTAVPEIFAPRTARMTVPRSALEAPTLILGGLESDICMEPVPRRQSPGRSLASQSPVLCEAGPKALPRAEWLVTATALTPQISAVQWDIRTADLPQYQPIPKSLPVRRGLVLSAPV
ncbi:MAG: hypothetical protein ABSB35_27125 [Bryobacteraceae bacterium]